MSSRGRNQRRRLPRPPRGPRRTQPKHDPVVRRKAASRRGDGQIHDVEDERREQHVGDHSDVLAKEVAYGVQRLRQSGRLSPVLDSLVAEHADHGGDGGQGHGDAGHAAAVEDLVAEHRQAQLALLADLGRARGKYLGWLRRLVCAEPTACTPQRIV